ncbi:class I SAM-dependent methyltransferase [Burkholderia arboris]|uniref:Class I SAM-dependent methyltransferase n=1 Tax=Burkholderia metallica TaxID=488729 RepID=A0ABT8PER6_9BURK|nr:MULTISPECIES: class I SAM-dependent methyltransferase [Burkholderia cepacia complex]MCA8037882.1 class I SAM-dependent methyltransferase [Burkholderia arboris]MDN7933625.1 class I SAM-dependent methyltransferase [Burkholderia metallica]
MNQILRQRTDLEGKVVVDLACGDGRTTHLLRELGAHVKPFDIMPEVYSLDGEPPAYADVMDSLPIESESVDMVVLQEVIEHLPNHLFALQEINRVLKAGGELFITTPNRSAFVSKLAFLAFESEHLRGMPAGEQDSVWGQRGTRKYYGHLFLIGVQQLRTLSLMAGFKSIRVHESRVSSSSAVLMILLYPIVALIGAHSYFRARRKAKCDLARAERTEQLRLNMNPRVLINKYLIASLVK